MFDENKHPRADDGKFTDGNGAAKSEKLKEAERVYNSEPQAPPKTSDKKKMTPAEKIASVHIDFDKDNVLPELNEEDLADVKSKINKPVLLKKGVIDKNLLKHNDLSVEDSERIISEALYSNKKEVIPSKHKEKPNYFTFAKIVRLSKKDGKPIYGVTLLDVDSSKDNFEIVHWHYVSQDNLNSLKPKDSK